jgi:hypothetical protein
LLTTKASDPPGLGVTHAPLEEQMAPVDWTITTESVAEKITAVTAIATIGKVFSIMNYTWESTIRGF